MFTSLRVTVPPMARAVSPALGPVMLLVPVPVTDPVNASRRICPCATRLPMKVTAAPRRVRSPGDETPSSDTTATGADTSTVPPVAVSDPPLAVTPPVAASISIPPPAATGPDSTTAPASTSNRLGVEILPAVAVSDAVPVPPFTAPVRSTSRAATVTPVAPERLVTSTSPLAASMTTDPVVDETEPVAWALPVLAVTATLLVAVTGPESETLVPSTSIDVADEMLFAPPPLAVSATAPPVASRIPPAPVRSMSVPLTVMPPGAVTLPTSTASPLDMTEAVVVAITLPTVIVPGALRATEPDVVDTMSPVEAVDEIQEVLESTVISPPPLRLPCRATKLCASISMAPADEIPSVAVRPVS